MNDLLERSLHGVAIYNPRLLSKEELIGFFVARQVELERLVEALRREAKAQPQHHLVVGARGMGKTTLLNRLRYAIEDDEELGSRCLGLVFPEEQYNVVCLADFWLNCVDALADGLESAGRTELVEGIDEEIGKIQELPRKDDRGRRALELLCKLSDRLQRRLVLLVDNVDLVLDRLEDEQWALREVLSSESRIQLIGATSAPLESHYRHDKAFYDFFRVHHLEGLSDEETFTVLRRLAEVTGHDRVARLLDEEPGRVKTVRLMAGGNPRTVVVLFSVLAQGTDGDVRTDIERLLDQCTPLYKHRIEVLPTQAQQVLDALAKHWAPATANEVANATHLQVNVVSAQLDRLVKDGTIEKVSLPDTKRQGFQIAERFFNIWCLMRASRRIRRRLVWLVEFLRLMFGAEDLASRARRHLATERTRDTFRRAELGLAFADLVEESPLRTALEVDSIRTLCIDPHVRRQLSELFDLDDRDRHLLHWTDRLRLMAEAHETVLATSVNLPNWKPEEYWSLLASSPVLSVQDKHQLALRLRNTPGPSIATHALLMRQLQSYLSGGFVPEEFDALIQAVQDGSIDIYGPTREELEAVAARGDRSVIPCTLALIHILGISVDYDWLASEIMHSRSLFPRILWATMALRNSVPKDHVTASLLEVHSTYTWGPSGYIYLGNALQDHFGDVTGAETAYRKGISLISDDDNPLDALAWYNLGLLYYRTGRYDMAEAEFERSTSKIPEHADSWFFLAMTLRSKDGRISDARTAAATAVTMEGAFHHIVAFATILMEERDWQQAAPYVERAVRAHTSVPLTDDWSLILDLFSTAVEHGFANEARGLLASIDVAERWKPLDIALAIIVHDDASALDRLAPEMREAVRLVLARISPQTLEEPTPSSSKRRRPATKKS